MTFYPLPFPIFLVSHDLGKSLSKPPYLSEALYCPAFRGIESEALHHVGCRASGREILTVLRLFQKS
jgi:hypothetical protein